jgi:hypothetical protein
VIPVLTDDWWATSEHLAKVSEDATGVELSATARYALVGMTVELLVLLTCWPGGDRPASALAYLRTRRARMARHAPWLYALPLCARRLLVGTDRLPSLLTFVVGGAPVDETLGRAWRKALKALTANVEAAESPGPRPGPTTTKFATEDAAPCLTPDRSPHDGGCRGAFAVAARRQSSARRQRTTGAQTQLPAPHPASPPGALKGRHHCPCRVGLPPSGPGKGTGHGTGVGRPARRRRDIGTGRGRGPPHDSWSTTRHRYRSRRGCP